ncbi:MAG: endolytic transglycosylase MltG [Roseburia sp.]|nr:endolytic transglycosylase MltG [Roseburia sp.]MCM1279382.1 endolytic transglycosylase MltG [Robinsoniella sp.]
MSAKQVAGAFFGIVFKIVIWAIIIMLVYKYAIYGYSFGFQVFSDRPVATTATGVTVNVPIVEGKSNMEIARLLKEKGLIADANVFYVQLMLSDYKDKLRPGIYDFSTTMTAEEMIKLMAEDPDETEEE